MRRHGTLAALSAAWLLSLALAFQGFLALGHFHDLRDTGLGTVIAVTPSNGVDGPAGVPVDDDSSSCVLYAAIHAAGSFLAPPPVVPVTVSLPVVTAVVLTDAGYVEGRHLASHRPRGPPSA